MNRTKSSRAIAIVASIATTSIVILALLATGVLGRDGPVKPSVPTSPPPAALSASPSPTPAVPAKPAPSADYATGVRVPLRTATGETKAVYVKDSTGMLVDAFSGVPREDVSVGARRVVVHQVDPRSLRVVWADTAINEDVSLSVSRAGGTLRIEMIRRHLSPDIEIAHERTVVLRFDTEVNAAGVAASIRNSLDTED
jgi:hypothetical protein